MIKHTLKTIFGDIVSYEREPIPALGLLECCRDELDVAREDLERARESAEFWRKRYFKQVDATHNTFARLNQATQRYDELKQAVQSALDNR